MQRSARPSLAFGNGRYMVTFAHDLGGALPAGEGAGQLLAIEAVRMASAALGEICAEIGQRTLGLAVWGSAGPTIVRWEPSRQPVSPHLQTGVVVSLTQSATGLAFAAFREEAATAPAVEAELRGRAGAGQPDGGQFASRVAEARAHGLARSVGQAPSERHRVTVNAFSAPVFDAAGQMVLALSTTCEAGRLPADWQGEVPVALRNAAQRLSQRLGHRPAPAGPR
jgi:DNA-binding IclR family transcriptional regulator